MQGKLRQIEKQCGKNCIRKFDRGYKLFNTVEKDIFESFIKESKIDSDDFLKEIEREYESKTSQDINAGDQLLESK